MKQEDFYVIKYKYDSRVYSLKYIFDLTTNRQLTKEEFHLITTYNYEGIKEDRGW